MENKRVYQIDLYEVKIGARIGKITVQYFKQENRFFCKFLNDSNSDFINSYESFGFIVDKTGNFTKLITAGTFTQEEAMSVWDQIEREEKPIESTHISIIDR